MSENTNTLKMRALEILNQQRELASTIEMTFEAAASMKSPPPFPPNMCEDVAEMLRYTWTIIDLQFSHIQRMHAVLDLLEEVVIREDATAAQAAAT